MRDVAVAAVAVFIGYVFLQSLRRDPRPLRPPDPVRRRIVPDVGPWARALDEIPKEERVYH